MSRPNVADALGLGRDSEGERIEECEMEDGDRENERDGVDGAISSKEGASTDGQSDSSHLLCSR